MISRLLGIATLVCLLFAWSAGAATAERRIALVIGNSAYQNVAQLPNPARDAAAIAAMFKKAGFNVVEEKSNLGNLKMRRVLRDFARKARRADIAVVYYAGHGIEVDGVNYLIPVDAKLASDIDVYDEAIPLTRIVSLLEPVRRLRLVILDACRENPFASKMTRTITTRSIGRGLAGVEVTSSDTLVAFAAKAGMTAADGDGAHSPYTAALLDNLAVPGLDLRLALGRVRDEVMKNTNDRQEPYFYGSIGGTTVSLVPEPKAPQVAAKPQPSSDDAEARDYAFAERIGTRQAWDTFLAAHGSGFYADLARAARAKLIAAQGESADATRKVTEEKAKRQAAADAAKPKADEEAAARKAAEEAATKKAAAEEERLKAKLAAPPPPGKSTVVASAPNVPAAAPERSPKPEIAAADIARELQSELKRVGCDPGAVDGKWGENTMHALRRFNRRAHTSLDVKVASLDALDVVKQHKDRVCPLQCRKGYKAEGDSCVAIRCRHGFVRNRQGECERPRRRTADRPGAHRRGRHGGSGQIFCGPRGGCRPVPPGCHIVFRDGVYGNSPGAALDCN